MDKTVVVEVERTVLHPRYHRYIRRRSRFLAHDEAGAAGIGDQVRIEETRPLSRRKRWMLREVLRKARA
jgi:small subunit ribosomal protein S17